MQIARDLNQRAFRHVTGQVHDDDWKFREVDLVHRIAVGPHREIRFGVVHRVAHVRHDFRLVPAELELQRHTGIAFGGSGGHGFQPVNVGQLGLHRAHQKLFGIRGGNAGEGDRNEQCRNFNIRLSFFWQANIGNRAGQNRQDHERYDHTGPFRGPVNDGGHNPVS